MVTTALYRFLLVVKKRLSRRAKLSVYRSVCVLTLASGPELWVLTGRTRSSVQAAEIRFLWRVAGLGLRDEEELRGAVWRGAEE